MASIKNLKKDLNFVFGDIIEAVHLWEFANNKSNSKEGGAIIDSAIADFDALIVKVNDRKVENRKKHLKGVTVELEEKATALVERLNSL